MPDRPYKIEIGKRELKATHLYHLIPHEPRHHFGAANFFVDLEKNPDFCEIDLRDKVIVTWTDTGEVPFEGFVHQASYGGSSACFLCYGGSRRLHEEKISSEPLGVRDVDALYFLTVSGGLKPRFLGVRQPNLEVRDFKVIFPILGLKIPCDFSIGPVRFIPSLQEESSDSAKKGKTLRRYPWSNASAFAVVALQASHFYDALVKAERRAQRAVDWIQLRTDLTIPCINIGGTSNKIGYSLRKNYSRFHLYRYGLAMEVKTGSAIFHLLDTRIGHPLVFNYNPDWFMEPLAPLYTNLMAPENENKSEVRTLNHALNWLTLSYENEAPVDNLLQLWIAFEFLCSGVSVPKLVKRPNLKKAVETIQGLDIPKDEKQAIVNSIGQVNPPLMARWERLLDELGISLTEQETMLISELRSARNDIIHGNDVAEPEIEKIEKFRSILERVFLCKVTRSD